MRRLLLSLACLGCAPAQTPWDDSLLRPFVMNHRSPAASLADVSFLLDAPAGRDGFVRVHNGHLARANGRRLKLWGVHLTDWSRGSVMLPAKDDAPLYAASLARFGINCVRLHFLDLLAPRGIIDSTRADTRAFDPQQLDRLDFLFAELKKRGIWIDLNLNVGRSYKDGDGVADAGKIRWGKGLVLFDPRLIELQREYARQLLTHRNPYTQLEYRHDPAIAIVEILNENALYLGFRAPTPHYDQLLTTQYNEWLPSVLGPEELAQLREIAAVPAGAPVPRLSGKETATAPPLRFRTEMRFYREKETAFYRDMAAFLRKDLGVKAPITGTADHSHSGSSYPMLSTLAKLDVVDGHVYWQHPGARGPVNTPMVNSPFQSTIVQLARTAVAGKPYTVSEVNHPFPNDWASEGIPALAAYGALHDWDAIILYTFEPKRDPAWQPYIGDPFDISLDPVRMTQMAAGALQFLRGDVRPARVTIQRSYSPEQVNDSVKLPSSQQPLFTPSFAPALALRHATRIASFSGPPTGSFPPAPPNPIVSDTGELAWHSSPAATGLITVDTPRTQALIGFINPNGKAVGTLGADLTNHFATLVLSSLDGQPIARSGKMLLSAASRVSNTGLRWNETRTRVTNQGGSPTLIEPVTGSLILRNLDSALSVSATALDGAGAALGPPVEAQKTAAGWTLPLGSPVTTWYVVTVRRK